LVFIVRKTPKNTTATRKMIAHGTKTRRHVTMQTTKIHTVSKVSLVAEMAWILGCTNSGLSFQKM
jgi:hypothetical protein